VSFFAGGAVFLTLGRRLGLCLMLASALAACAEPASKPIAQEQLSQANSQADMNTLKSRTQEMRMRLDEIEAILGRQGTGFTLEDVNRRLAQLEETVSRMAATLGIDTGRRAAGPNPAIAPPAVSGGVAEPYAGSGAVAGEAEPATPLSPPAGPITMGSSTDPAEAIFNMAMESYNQRDYDRANSLFSEMLKSYPASRQAPEALFWQAETNYQQGDYARAALICQDLIQKYPNHPRAPSAMLKQALCFRKLGKGQAAKILLQDVAKRYPDSPEARSAQAQLRELR